jgi:hypothetical protein
MFKQDTDRIIPVLGLGSPNVDTLNQILSDLAIPAYIDGLRRPFQR